MATARQICAQARLAMKQDSVIISGADFDENGRIARLQVYFWDQKEAVMDLIDRADLIENWPDAGVFVIDPAAADQASSLRPVRIVDGEEDFYLRAVPEDRPADDLGPIPSAVALEALELICQLKDSKLK